VQRAASRRKQRRRRCWCGPRASRRLALRARQGGAGRAG
jgi:hypothetical protein